MLLLNCDNTGRSSEIGFFFKLKDISHLGGGGAQIPPFWTSGDVCPGFQNQGGSTRLYASLLACNGFLRFTSGAIPADLLVVSMAAKSFNPHLWDSNPELCVSYET